MFRRRLSIRRKGISDSEFAIFRNIAEGVTCSGTSIGASSTTGRSFASSIHNRKQKVVSALPVYNSDDDEDSSDSSSSDEASYCMRGALRVQNSKRSRMDLSSNVSLSESRNKKIRPTSVENAETSIRNQANDSHEVQNTSTAPPDNENTIDLQPEITQFVQDSITEAHDLDANREHPSTSVETETVVGERVAVDNQVQQTCAIETEAPPAQDEKQMSSGSDLVRDQGGSELDYGDTPTSEHGFEDPSAQIEKQMTSGADIGCGAGGSELDYGDTPLSEPASEAEEPVLDDHPTLQVQSLETLIPCAVQEPNREPNQKGCPRLIPGKPIVQISEHMRKFLDSVQPEPGSDMEEMNIPEGVILSESEESEAEIETQAPESDFEPENQDSVVAHVDSDMKMFSKLQNALYCGTHIDVPVNAASNEAVYFTRSDGHWNLVYPGCYYSQQEHGGHRYGMIEMCAHTIRPFEVLGTRQPMFVWVLKGEIVLKTNAIELMSENGIQVPVLRSFVFKKGDLMVIPGDIPHSLVNKTDEMVRLGFTCFF